MEKKGKLTIFFGYCAGVGKTYSMLNKWFAESRKQKNHIQKSCFL